MSQRSRATGPSSHGRAAGRGALVALVVAGVAITGIALAVDDDQPAMSVATATTLTTTDPAATGDAGLPSATLPLATDPGTSLLTTTVAPTVSTAAPTSELVPTTVGGEVPGSIAPTTLDPTAATAPGTSVVAGAPAPPAVDATAYAVLDTSTGTWLATSAADEQLAVGSTMKLLTTYVVMQAGDPEHVVTVPQLELDPEESSIGLYPGERLSRAVLLRAMLIVSANDAARSLAVDVGGSQDGFVAMMNTAASTLGLAGTVAANPIGLDATGAHSTARDLATLAALLMQDETFRATVARTSASLHGQTLPSTNAAFLTGYPGADGVKTGHTSQAGYCLVASATRDGRRLVAVVLGSSTDSARVSAVSALLDWAFALPA